MIMKSINLFNTQSQYQLQSITKALESIGITYVSYIFISPNGKRFHYHTNQNWSDLFLGNNLLKDCVLNHFCETVNRPALLSWDNAHIGTRAEKNVMWARHDMQIYNGITITDFFSGCQDIIALGTNHEKYDVFDLYVQSRHIIRESLIDCRRVALGT